MISILISTISHYNFAPYPNNFLVVEEEGLSRNDPLPLPSMA